MPKISEEKREGRRDQILAAVWQCFLRRGVHRTSMEDILRESGLSAGAVYLYYKGKDEIILAAISTYMGRLGSLLMPVLTNDTPPPPPEFIRQVLAVLRKHTRRAELDLNPIILMGWSEAQTNQDVRAMIQQFQFRYRDALVRIARTWQKQKCIAFDANPEDVGKALMSFFLGSIAQQALLGEVEPEALILGLKGFEPTQPSKRKSKSSAEA